MRPIPVPQAALGLVDPQFPIACTAPLPHRVFINAGYASGHAGMSRFGARRVQELHAAKAACVG